MFKTPAVVRATLVLPFLVMSSFSAQAISITLPTTNLDAEAVFSFSGEASGLFSMVGVSASALGTTKAEGTSGWSFMMPVTEVTLNASIFPLRLSPVAGEAMGAGLLIQKGSSQLSLANFTLDFSRNVMLADISSRNGYLAQIDLFDFKVKQGLHLSTSGGLSMAMTLENMSMSAAAQTQFIQGLRLNAIERLALPSTDFGALSINIAPGLRFGVSDKPLFAPVPELSTWAMLASGMLGIAFVSRRKLTG